MIADDAQGVDERLRPAGPDPRDAQAAMSSPVDAPWFMASVAQEYPGLAHTRLGDEDVYIVSDPAAIVKIFIEQGRHTTKGQDLKGRGVVGADPQAGEGETHMRHRRLAQPAFHADRLAEYGADVVEMVRRHSAGWHEGQSLDMQESMASLCLVTLARSLFGSDVADSSGTLHETLGAVVDAMDGRLLVDASAGAPDGDHRQQRDMLSLLLAAQAPGFGFDDPTGRDAALRAVLSDPEPTAMNLTWTWLLLAQNPDAATWLHEELDAVLRGRDPSVDDLVSLPRTRAVLTESMRLYPPAWIQGRRLAEDVQVDGRVVPAGSLAMASQFALHRSPRWWEAAGDFRPQRWIDADGAFSEDGPGQPRGAWFPFGTGGRRCIGERLALMEAGLILAFLAQTWAPELHLDPGAVVRPRGDLTLRADGGVPMRLRRRSSIA